MGNPVSRPVDPPIPSGYYTFENGRLLESSLSPEAFEQHCSDRILSWQYWLFKKDAIPKLDMYAPGHWGTIDRKTVAEAHKNLLHDQKFELQYEKFFHLPPHSTLCTSFNPIGPIAILKSSSVNAEHHRSIANELADLYRQKEEIMKSFEELIQGLPPKRAEYSNLEDDDFDADVHTWISNGVHYGTAKINSHSGRWCPQPRTSAFGVSSDIAESLHNSYIAQNEAIRKLTEIQRRNLLSHDDVTSYDIKHAAQGARDVCWTTVSYLRSNPNVDECDPMSKGQIKQMHAESTSTIQQQMKETDEQRRSWKYVVKDPLALEHAQASDDRKLVRKLQHKAIIDSPTATLSSVKEALSSNDDEILTMVCGKPGARVDAEIVDAVLQGPHRRLETFKRLAGFSVTSSQFCTWLSKKENSMHILVDDAEFLSTVRFFKTRSPDLHVTPQSANLLCQRRWANGDKFVDTIKVLDATLSGDHVNTMLRQNPQIFCDSVIPRLPSIGFVIPDSTISKFIEILATNNVNAQTILNYFHRVLKPLTQDHIDAAPKHLRPALLSLASRVHRAEAQEQCTDVASPVVFLGPDCVGWVPDSDARCCSLCGRWFDWPFVRRHHCRTCGQIVCYACYVTCSVYLNCDDVALRRRFDKLKVCARCRKNKGNA